MERRGGGWRAAAAEGEAGGRAGAVIKTHKLFLKYFNAYLKKAEIIAEISGYKQRIINFEYDLQKLSLEEKRIPLEKIELKNQLEEIRILIINNKTDCQNKLDYLQDKLYSYE